LKGAGDSPGEPEGFIPYSTWSYVKEQLSVATFIDVSQSFTEIMLIKSDEELAMVKSSAQIGESVCETM
jgi:Xaa-Pro dipeptidase